jgi:hypothetical protein
LGISHPKTPNAGGVAPKEAHPPSSWMKMKKKRKRRRNEEKKERKRGKLSQIVYSRISLLKF